MHYSQSNEQNKIQRRERDRERWEDTVIQTRAGRETFYFHQFDPCSYNLWEANTLYCIYTVPWYKHQHVNINVLTCCVPSGLPSSWVKPVGDWRVFLWPSISGLEPYGKSFQVWWASATVLAHQPALPPGTEISVVLNTSGSHCVSGYFWL